MNDEQQVRIALMAVGIVLVQVVWDLLKQRLPKRSAYEWGKFFGTMASAFAPDGLRASKAAMIFWPDGV
jgi:hypothetical protein